MTTISADKNNTKETPKNKCSVVHSKLRPYYSTIAAFILGMELPKIEFAHILDAGLIALGILLLMVWLITHEFIISWSKKINLSKRMILGIRICICICAVIGSGIGFMNCSKSPNDALPKELAEQISQLFVNQMNQQHQINIDLKQFTKALVTDITQFISQRQTGVPSAVDSKWTSVDEWFQAVRIYTNETTTMFTKTYHQRVIDLAYNLRQQGIISDDELKETLWFAQVNYPTPQWVLDSLEKFSTRFD